MKDYTCRICNHIFSGDSMMAYETRCGWNEEFEYVRCPNCGTIQICKMPEDIGRYYSSSYYSMEKISSNTKGKHFQILARKLILKYKTQRKSFLGKILSAVFNYDYMYKWVHPYMFNENSKILDVGCGSGKRIFKMAQCGYKNLSGIDPYIDNDISYNINRKQTLLIEKKQLEKVTDKYDCVMLHHVIEHMPDPCAALKYLPSILNENGVLIIALPVFSHFGWEQYGMLSLPFADAPRHYHIFESDYFIKLVKSFGFDLVASIPQFDNRIFKDARGNVSDCVQKSNRKGIRNRLISENDTGIVALYFKLRS